MDLYAENILDHYRHPRGKASASLSEESCSAIHHEDNPACGDELTIALTLDGDTITDISWSGTGCAISQAGMSMLHEELIGRSTDEVLNLNKEDVYEMLGIPIGPRRFKCALIGLHTLKNCIRKTQNGNPQSWLDTVGYDDIIGKR